jgi:hypothetical protein
MKFYKVISKDNKSISGGNFDYTEYLPKRNIAGKWLPIIENIKECEKGYHVTNYWNMWLESKDNRIFEVKVNNLLDKKETVGVIDKYVCGSFRFIKEIKVVFDEKTNTGDSNTGDSNTGDWNTGDSNTGHRNTGHSNTGHWNTSNFNNGYFNTKEVKIIKIFNKNCSKKVWDNCKKPKFIYFDLTKKDYKGCFKESFDKTTKEDVELLIKLPNFNYKVFEEISGITKSMINKKLK